MEVLNLKILVFGFMCQFAWAEIDDKTENMPSITLYSKLGQQGDSLKVNVDYAPSLGPVRWDNKAKSGCVRGLWLLYENADFNGPKSGKMFYMWGNKRFCTDLGSVSGTVSSFRFVGHATDITKSSITFYEKDYFQGKERFIGSYREYFNETDPAYKSLIITGKSPYTISYRINRKTNEKCLLPQFENDFNQLLISDIRKVGIPYGSIYRAVKGCS